jgi:iron complex outermembrane receptor protein
MISRSIFSYALRGTLLGGMLAFVGPLAWAQQAPVASVTSPTPALEEVIVTGTRIVAPNLKSTSPVAVVTSQDILLSGKSDISDILYQLPQNFNNSLGQDFSGRTSGLSSAGGITTADLRGLGPNRTLVLVNGRRLGNGDPNTAIASPAPDLDQIPTMLVERVDVVTGGASATYGSDAISGVVNFILKRNFEGFQVDDQLGENWHDNHNTFAQSVAQQAEFTAPSGSEHDGRNKSFNMIAGTNFADGKGNITAYAGYLQSAPVLSGQRDFGACQADLNAAGTGPTCMGTASSNSNYFDLAGSKSVYSVLGNKFIPFGSATTNPPQFYNSQPDIYISRGDERYTAGFLGHVDLNDYAKPYFEFGFMNDKTHTEIAPSALFRGGNPLDPAGNYNINCSNPLLSAQQAAILCTPAQIAADAAAPGSDSANVEIGRRNIEGGNREADYEHTNYRAVGGIKGDFATAWNYDAYGLYYYTTFYNDNTNYLNFQSIANALQVTGTAANPVCISGSPCVPYNIFTSGAVTAKQLNYLELSGTAYGTNTERIAHADISGDLGKYGVTSPLANDGIGVNFGYEHRNEFVQFQPDSAEQSGLLAGFGGASVPINNGYSVDEQFLELRAPIAQDQPWAKELVFDAGVRRSDYTTSGVVNTRKFEVQYAPIGDVRFRASYQRAIRAPSIIELYNPQLVGQIQIGNDPCAPVDATHPATATLAECLHTGVTAAQYGNGGSTNLIPQGTAGQLSQEEGGNPNLKPEQGDSYTFGVTLTPGFLSNFTATADYYRILLKNTIGSLPANIVLQNCLTSGNPLYCSQIVRNPVTGGLTGASVAAGGYIVQTNVNIGAAEVSGIDVGTNYKLPLSDRGGAILFNLNGTYELKNTTTPYVGAPSYDCAGLFGSTCQTVNPRWRHTLRATWETPWRVSLAATWRFIGKVGLDYNDSDPSLNRKEGFNFFSGSYVAWNATIPNYSYLDLAATWHALDHLDVRAGINNLLDKDPPYIANDIVAGGSPNTYETYDTLGRQIFIGFTAKF